MKLTNGRETWCPILKNLDCDKPACKSSLTNGIETRCPVLKNLACDKPACKSPLTNGIETGCHVLKNLDCDKPACKSSLTNGIETRCPFLKKMVFGYHRAKPACKSPLTNGIETGCHVLKNLVFGYHRVKPHENKYHRACKYSDRLGEFAASIPGGRGWLDDQLIKNRADLQKNPGALPEMERYLVGRINAAVQKASADDAGAELGFWHGAIFQLWRRWEDFPPSN
uniref:Uncharacterized protein n=1 Tax=Lobelia galpinii TaxID=2041126 RepID=A0A291EXV3_9ASTR|nr:hypothetical protein Lo_gal1Pt0651 [Lobelia galpinii]ATG24706.1 hypothetical protein Lo_gal1Pt0651 [Lobelia galpinii]